MRILISGGTIVNAAESIQSDILIENQKITQIGTDLNSTGATVIDARGKYVFPGFIDTHTHLDLVAGGVPTADDFPTGTRAAVLGGTTTVLDFATQERGMTMVEAMEEWKEKARHASCNYGFHMAVSEWNPERAGELDRMVEEGITSFKMYMVYSNMRVSDGDIYAALQETGKRDCLIGVHCENDDILQKRICELHEAGRYDMAAHSEARPAQVEAEAVARLMRTAQLANAPVYVVHLSTEEGLKEALRARERGQEVYLETCPQYLVQTEARYLEPDAEKYIMSPPLRKESDQNALWEAIAQGEIDFIGTDHCSFTMEQKALGGGDFAKTPNGGAGIQNRAELVYTYGVKTGKITVNQMVDQLSAKAARIFGMPNKGEIRVGADGDIVVFDPEASGVISHKTNAHNCDNSAFEGIETFGRATDVLVNGQIAVRDGRLVQEGLGRYVHRETMERTRR